MSKETCKIKLLNKIIKNYVCIAYISNILKNYT